MTVFAIDPGETRSAYVIFEPPTQTIKTFALVSNQEMLKVIPTVPGGWFVAEMMACYGMPVGAEVLETCVWTGRFIDRWNSTQEGAAARIFRREVKLNLCSDSRAKDSNIRQALIDRFGPGKDRAIGTKKNPGPLYGIAADVWSALAVAVTFSDVYLTKGEQL